MAEGEDGGGPRDEVSGAWGEGSGAWGEGSGARDERSEAARTSRRQGYRTVFWVVVPLLLLMAAFPLFVQLDWFGFRFRVLGLLLLGMLASIGLAAGLMAASFHSARSGIDEESGVLPGDLPGGEADDPRHR